MRRVILACATLLCLTFSTLRAEAPVGVAVVPPPMMKYSVNSIQKRISDAASTYNIDPDLALAIAEVESSFNPNVQRLEPKFHTWSVGLFQMFIPTARAYGFRGTMQQLKEPRTNIHFGMIHLSKCVDRFGQQLVEMVACCHNAGVGVKDSVCINNPSVKDYIRKVVESYDRRKLLSAKLPAVVSL